MQRIKPYECHSVTWNTILNKNLNIPMNQREYSWQEPQIKAFLKDIIDIFEGERYVEKMGSIINLKINNNNDIYDGQQRILTTILILSVMRKLTNRQDLKEKIDSLLSADKISGDLSAEQLKIQKKFKVSIIPKIYCVNPNDNEALVFIFNNKIKFWFDYLENLDSLYDLSNSKDSENLYICKNCLTEKSSKKDFIKLITKDHNYEKPILDTKLYDAFSYIFCDLKSRKYDDAKLILLYRFIINDIDIQLYDCSDPEYVSRIFDWENNRGKAVETLDIIKNPILVKIEDNKKLEVYTKWEELKHRTHKSYKNIGEKIFELAIQLYNSELCRKITNSEVLFKKIINGNTYEEINNLFNIVEKLWHFMDLITNDTYGRLITSKSGISISLEGFIWCLLPIFYIINKKDENLIKLFTKWYFRNNLFKTRTFNNFIYSNEFIRITNELLKNKDFNYYQEIDDCLKRNKDDKINEANYKKSLSVMEFKSTKATSLLLFLETCLTSDLNVVSLDYTLEHIYCKKDKNNLTNSKLLDNIGNLTLIEGPNSKNGHKGNSSLGSKPYSYKKDFYKESSSKITRDIALEFITFSEEDIQKRNKIIVSLLNQHTIY